MTTERRTAAAATEDSVIADDGVKFIYDVRNVEDLLLLPNTKWVIGSGFNWEPDSQNYLHLFNVENETGAAVQPFEIAIRPDTVAYPDCQPATHCCGTACVGVVGILSFVVLVETVFDLG